MVNLKSKMRFYRSLFVFCRCGGKRICNGDSKDCGATSTIIKEIEWEVRPGGMLVQKRDTEGQRIEEKEGFITVRVVTGSLCHDITIQPTSTIGEMKMMLSMVIGIEPNDQRLLFQGKERNDTEHLHMIGVKDKDKVVMLVDPVIKESKLHGLPLPTTNHHIMDLLTLH